MTTINPVFYKTLETPGYIDTLENDIKRNAGKDYDLLLNYPAIYIHVWQLISKNELRVLMTRGTKGLYIYACDEDLRDALKDSISTVSI